MNKKRLFIACLVLSSFGLVHGEANAGYLACLTTNFKSSGGNLYTAVSCSKVSSSSADDAKNLVINGCKAVIKKMNGTDKVAENACTGKNTEIINTAAETAVAGSIGAERCNSKYHYAEDLEIGKASAAHSKGDATTAVMTELYGECDQNRLNMVSIGVDKERMIDSSELLATKKTGLVNMQTVETSDYLAKGVRVNYM
ncbi:MAG: hypothetical protein AAGA27_06840 [Pseudomonadota bacterium]